MSVSTNNKEAEEFLSGKLAQVNVAQIEKELRGLWKEAAHGDPDSDTGTLVRACSFNLILVTDDDDAESKGSDLLDEIEQYHPCRSILAIYRKNKSAHQLNAWVSARCHTVGPQRQICSEQITVCCDGGRPYELSSVVLPLVLPGLPVFIWWRQDRFDGDEIDALHGSARRFIFDSDRQPFDMDVFKDARQLIDQRGDSLHVSDLNWRRLHGWCRAIADAFDGFPMPADMLPKIAKVTMKFTGGSTASNRVLLLTGWLASRLNWQPTAFSAQSTGTSFRGAGGNVEIVFAADKSSSVSHITEVLFEFSGDARKLVVSPERTDEARFIIATLGTDDETEATRISPVLSETVLVGQELEVLTGSPVYDASVEMVNRLLSLRK